MSRLSLRHWLNRMARSTRSGRQKTDPPSRRRTRLHLESFEDRCVPSTVTNLSDHDPGSLRDAIATTPAGGTVDFQPGLTGTITLTSGELAISKDLTIDGPGAGIITVSGNDSSRAFDLTSGTAMVSLTGLTIANGHVGGLSPSGGGIYIAGGVVTIMDSVLSGNGASGDGAAGGAIGNEGSLTITNSTLSGNTVSAGADYAWGGAIYNGGSLTITNSTLSGNTAMATTYNGTIIALGGGIMNNFATGALTVTNSTISGNTAQAIAQHGGHPYSDGGGITNSGTLTVTDSTLSGNSAGVGGGIDIFGGQPVIAKNMILAGNKAALDQPYDLAGALNSQGHNLIGDGTGGSGFDPTDLVGTRDNPIDPKLGPLQDNGGPTFTMALLPGSPAIDAGDPTGAPEWDQRGPGYPRVVNGKIDIGAYEHQPVAPTITCSVADSLLWPPFHELVNVGLSVDVQPPDATLQVQVYANDNANASDAAAIAPDTLQLRAARQGHGQGRVYLIVVTASNSAGSAFDVCTVVVPHDQSAGSIAQVQAEAAAAEAYYRQFQTAPAGYALLGEGPSSPGGNNAPNGTVPATGFVEALPTSQARPAVPGNTVTAVAPSAGPVSPEVQPDQPSFAGTVSTFLPPLNTRHATDAAFAGWDTVADGPAWNAL